MNRLQRGLLIGTMLVLMIFIGLALFFYRPTRTALERAEAFQFRRMQVSKLSEKEVYRFFFVTNRRMYNNRSSVEERFVNQRQKILIFGHFDTRLEPTLGVGMIINPTDWFQNEEIKLKTVRILEQNSFLDEISKQVAASPFRSLLIVINGYRERFPTALRKTAFLAHVLDIDSPVLVFDWPGDQGSTIRGYRRARQVAGESGAELARTLEIVIRHVRPQRLWLFANSMGAEVVVNSFGILHRSKDLADAETEIEHVVLTAPDVDKTAFKDQFEQEMTDLARHLTVYVSSNDRALLISRVINRARRLGESRLDPWNPDQFETADVFFDLIRPENQRVVMVDVTPVNRTRNFHNFSLEIPEFFDDVYLRLINMDMPQSRTEYRIETPSGRSYRVLTRGR